MLLLTTSVLRKAGYDVLETSTGKECLEVTRAHRPDLILLDIMLPDISGLEVLKEIKTDPELSNTLVVLVSGIQTSSDHQAGGLNVGADGYIVKPIPNKELLARVQAMERINRAEEALKESEKRYREFADLLPQTVVEFDEKGIFTFVNNSGLEIFGYTKEDIKVGLSVFQTITPDDHNRLKKNMELVMRGEVSNGNEYAMAKKDGSTFPALIHSSLIVRDSKVKGLRAIVIDITDRKRAEEALRQSEARYRRLFDDAIIGVFQSTPDGKIIAINGAYARMFGYESPDELIAAVSDVASDLYADPTRRPPIVEMIKQAGQSLQVENVYKRKDGSTFIGNLHAWSAQDGKGGFILEGFVEDITERTRAEEALKESEERYRIAIEGSLDGVIIVQNDVHVYVNRSYLNMFGYDTLDEIVGKDRYCTIHPDDHERVAGYTRARQKGEYAPTRYEFKGIRKDGTPIDIEVSANTILYKGEQAILAYLRDITERSQVRETNARLAAIVQSSYDAIIGKDLIGTMVSWNKGAEKIYGYTAEEAINKSISILVPPDHFDEVPGFLERIRRGESIEHYETVRLRKDGSRIDVSLTISPIKDTAGTITGASTIARDITERKRSEEALRVSRLQLSEAMDLAHIVYWEFDPVTETYIFNDPFYAFYGTTAEQEGGYRMAREEYAQRFIHPDDLQRYYQLVEQNTSGPGSAADLEHRIVRRNGEVRHILVRARIVKDDSGRVLRRYGANQDITERKRAEAVLLESQLMTRATIDALSAALCVLDEEGTILDVNRAWRKFADENPPIPPGYAVGMNYLGVCDAAKGPCSEEAAPFAEGIRGVIKGDIDEFALEYPCHSSQEERWFIGRVTRFPGNAPLRLVITHENITDRKRAELVLRENKARLDLALQSAGMGAWHWDIIENRRYFDEQACHLLGIDPSTFTGSPGEFFRAVHPDDRETIEAALTRTMEQGVPYEVDYRTVWPDGSIHHISARGLLVRDDMGRPLRLNGIIWDVTSRKLAEEALKASLHEKEVLLKEIHHRVKNNLAVISSILKLQAAYVHDEKIQETLAECQNRIKCMVLIHTRLYQSADLSNIDVKEYIQTLASDLMRSYARIPGKVDLRTYFDTVSLDIDTIIPLGLIVNELVSNALKHAFPGEKGGEVIIKLYHSDDSVVLAISDNGVGLPEGFDITGTEGLGMALVKALADQLDGHLTWSSVKGTEWRITFPAGGSG